MQEHESDSLPIENDPIVVDTQIVEPSVQQTVDGKKSYVYFILLQQV